MMEPSHAHATQMQHFNLFDVYQIQPSLLDIYIYIHIYKSREFGDVAPHYDYFHGENDEYHGIR